MGTPLVVDAHARVHIFASPTAWIEDAAVRQLEHLASRRGVTAVAGMPDLHPGHHGPVGAAALAGGIVHDDVIGTDIRCTMLFVSHDRHVLARLFNRVLEVTPEGVHQYGGGYTEYVERVGYEAPGLRA